MAGKKRTLALYKVRDFVFRVIFLYTLWKSEAGHTIRDQAAWFSEGVTIRDLQLPADEQLKLRIAGHLRRIHANFMANKGNFTLRPCEDTETDLVCAVPRGALNAKQRTVIDHVLNNWLTVVQGAPGSGKTAVGITHAATIFHWIEALTHVGRQASALCDLLGGHTDNARTIHGHFHRVSKSALYQEYAANKEVLILDEVYNADDWTFEKVHGVFFVRGLFDARKKGASSGTRGESSDSGRRSGSDSAHSWRARCGNACFGCGKRVSRARDLSG